jgi:hypothetical protein
MLGYNYYGISPFGGMIVWMWKTIDKVTTSWTKVAKIVTNWTVQYKP